MVNEAEKTWLLGKLTEDERRFYDSASEVMRSMILEAKKRETMDETEASLELQSESPEAVSAITEDVVGHVLQRRHVQTGTRSTCPSVVSRSYSETRMLMKEYVFPVYKFVYNKSESAFGSRFCKKVFKALGEKPEISVWEGEYRRQSQKHLNSLRSGVTGRIKDNFIRKCLKCVLLEIS